MSKGRFATDFSKNIWHHGYIYYGSHFCSGEPLRGNASEDCRHGCGTHLPTQRSRHCLCDAWGAVSHSHPGNCDSYVHIRFCVYVLPCAQKAQARRRGWKIISADVASAEATFFRLGIEGHEYRIETKHCLVGTTVTAGSAGRIRKVQSIISWRYNPQRRWTAPSGLPRPSQFVSGGRVCP
jgi:hypothetical protein